MCKSNTAECVVKSGKAVCAEPINACAFVRCKNGFTCKVKMLISIFCFVFAIDLEDELCFILFILMFMVV